MPAALRQPRTRVSPHAWHTCAGEFFFEDTGRRLLYVSNTSSPLPSPHDRFEATALKTLFALEGADAHHPVVGVRISGLVLKDTKETFLARA